MAPLTPDGPAVATSITLEETAALGSLALGRDCLEVGSALGYSAIMMVRLGARSVTAIDWHQPCDSGLQEEGTYEAMQKHLRWYKADSAVTMIRQSSQEALPDLIAQGREYGLAFIDSDHSYESVRHDVSKAIHLVPSGFIASHDYGDGGIESVTRALDDIFPGGPDWLIGTLHVVKVRG